MTGGEKLTVRIVAECRAVVFRVIGECREAAGEVANPVQPVEVVPVASDSLSSARVSQRLQPPCQIVAVGAAGDEVGLSEIRIPVDLVDLTIIVVSESHGFVYDTCPGLTDALHPSQIV